MSMRTIDMKCVNCGGEDFEKAERDGIFTLPYSFKYTDAEVPRYFYACLSCGLVHQVLDLQARKDKIIELVDAVLIDKLLPDRNGNYMKRISVKEISQEIEMPYSMLRVLIEETHSHHSGLRRSSFGQSVDPRIVPTLVEDKGTWWIVGKR